MWTYDQAICFAMIHSVTYPDPASVLLVEQARYDLGCLGTARDGFHTPGIEPPILSICNVERCTVLGRLFYVAHMGQSSLYCMLQR